MKNKIHFKFLFRLIKPKKVFFMAVDGVAPRAKMNQQRARRFRAGRDRMRKLRAIAEKNNQTLKEVAANHFDTNAITPGILHKTFLVCYLKYFFSKEQNL
jgi:5'-3' exoribonuclease 1